MPELAFIFLLSLMLSLPTDAQTLASALAVLSQNKTYLLYKGEDLSAIPRNGVF